MTAKSIESNDPHGLNVKQSPIKTRANVIKTIVGAGIFSTAAALNKSGFYFGMLLILAMGCLFYWSIITLAKASVKSNTPDIQSLVKQCFGGTGVVLLNIFLVCISWGACAAYTVIIGDVLPDVLSIVMGSPQTDFMRWFLSRRGMVILTSILILFPVSSQRTLHGLGKFSLFALGCIIFIIFVVVIDAALLPESYKGDTSAPLPFIKPEGITAAIGTFAFAYVCQQNILLNFHSMKNATINKFKRCIQDVMVLTVLLTVIVGLCYISLREKAVSNILNAFPKGDTIIVICRVLFAIDLFFTYPLEGFCSFNTAFIIRDTIEKGIFGHYGLEFSPIRHYAITALIVFSTCITACFTCDLGLIIELTGGIGASMLAFIIPSACLIKTCYDRAQQGGKAMEKKSLIFHSIFILFGFALMIMTIVTNVEDSFIAKAPKQCGF